jgi:hypothetical protein
MGTETKVSSGPESFVALFITLSVPETYGVKWQDN